jgi:exosome complex exonuclease RRP6
MEEDGFQLVCGKNKKKSAKEESLPGSSYSATGVSVATKDRRISAAKPKVPFHIPSIPRPQDEYRIIVNNANIPFQHVWLEQSEDGSRLIHPLVHLSLSLSLTHTLL